MEEKGNDEKTDKERVKNRKEFTVTVLMRVVLARKRYKIYMGCLLEYSLFILYPCEQSK